MNLPIILFSIWAMAVCAGCAIRPGRGLRDPLRLAIFTRHCAALAAALFFLTALAGGCMLAHALEGCI